MDWNYLEKKIYAGVLGKILGVYLGRPIEGWAYRDIKNQFGDVNYYVHKEVGVPLIVADDDISGTFGFFRSLKDNDFNPNITAKEIGDTWLNYIIENKTILWWGGLGRSTEHTAYLNLKNGIPAPRSGSIIQNGKDVAEQIGAQIFIEAFAMCYPGDPERTVRLVREAASVSHDGMAVDAAIHLAAMDSMAFYEKNIDKLLDEAFRYTETKELQKLIHDVRNACGKTTDWRTTREYLDTAYGYHLYPGTCHIAPNHAMVLASLLHGGDNFQKSIMIAASAGWDTDCNAGNIGALNGIRLGLDGINEGADLRTEVADRLLVITSDGGSAVSDAVLETEKIVYAAKKLNGYAAARNNKRFHFKYPGSLQGFSICPYFDKAGLFSHVFPSEDGTGILLMCHGLGKGIETAVSTPTFVDFTSKAMNYLSTASPTLYETQTVSCRIQSHCLGKAKTALYVVYQLGAEKKILSSDYEALTEEVQTINWCIPALGGAAILRVGVKFSAEERFDGEIKILEMDWQDAPKQFRQNGILMSDIWDLNPQGIQMWTSSAKNFTVDMQHTFCISHPESNGVVTIGTNTWRDYCVHAKILLGLHENAGLVIRSNGHRQYYGLGFKKNCLELFMMKNEKREVLNSCPFETIQNKTYDVSLICKHESIQVIIGDEVVLQAQDCAYESGGCGFFVDCGTFLADDFSVSYI